MEWVQIYDPLGNAWLSTLAAALPILLLLGTLAILEWKAHWAALAGLSSALLISVVVYGMPARTAAATAVYGAAYGLFPIGWIILNAVFLYSLTVATGQFEIVKRSVARLSADRRVQALLIAFSFGAFIEGAAGFGTPVAITAALLMGLGFTPLYAAGLSLIANTAPGRVWRHRHADPHAGRRHRHLARSAERDGRTPAAVRVAPRSGVAGRHDERMARASRRVAGGARVRRVVRDRAVPLEQLTSGPSSSTSWAAWCRLAASRSSARGGSRPKTWDFPLASGAAPAPVAGAARAIARAELVRAWMPWVFLSVFVTVWGIGPTKAFLNAGPAGAAIYREKHVAPPPHAVLSPAFEVPGLHRMVYREHPVEVDAVDRARMHDAGLQGQARRSRALHLQLALGHGNRHPPRGARDGALPAHSADGRARHRRHDASIACAGRS